MFESSCEAALHYTIPVVITSHQVDGSCNAGIGAATLINEDGWFLTAAHIGNAIFEKDKEVVARRSRVSEEEKIRADSSLEKRERQKKLRALGKEKPTDTKNWSVLWGSTGGTVQQLQVCPGIDLAVGKLENTSVDFVKTFPKIRKGPPSIGTTICRYGFPLHNVPNPTWNEDANTFEYPNNLFPIPMFANEGIVARVARVQIPNGQVPPPSFPLQYIETSSPGLKGQSGGPIFDQNGTLWGIQSQTTSYPLGFSPQINGQIEHQVLNVGLGVDAETVAGFLDSLSIAYHT